MWKKIVKAVTSKIIPTLSKPLENQTSSSIQPKFNINLSNINNNISNDNIKNEAREKLREAVRELSGLGLGGDLYQNPQDISNIPLSNLKKWNDMNINELEIDQLELLARTYFEGINEGFNKNIDKAIDIWNIAAKKGSIEAQYSLAICIRDGVGKMEKDSNKAFNILISLAEQKNYHLAHYACGIMLDKGEGIEIDHVRSFKHFKEAGLRGVLPALHNMANAYYSGKGVEKDIKKAAYYYKAGAEAGNPFSKHIFANWLYEGKILKMDRPRAFRMQLEAAQMGHPGATYNVGSHYMSGEGIEQDMIKASEWFLKAGELGLVEGKINAGNLYRQGLGVEKDLKKALEIFESCSTTNQICKEMVEEINKELKEDKSI